VRNHATCKLHHFPGRCVLEKARQGFAAMQASALQRTPVMNVNRECSVLS
jgi:hypothetical protein